MRPAIGIELHCIGNQSPSDQHGSTIPLTLIRSQEMRYILFLVDFNIMRCLTMNRLHKDIIVGRETSIQKYF